MKILFSFLFALILSVDTFAVLVPNAQAGDESGLEARAKAKVAAKKPVVKAPVVVLFPFNIFFSISTFRFAEEACREACCKPAVKPVVKPVAKPATKPAVQPVTKPVAKPATPVASPVAKPTATPSAVATPAAQPSAVATPAVKPSAVPAASCPIKKPAAKTAATKTAAKDVKAKVKRMFETVTRNIRIANRIFFGLIQPRLTTGNEFVGWHGTNNDTADLWGSRGEIVRPVTAEGQTKGKSGLDAELGPGLYISDTLGVAEAAAAINAKNNNLKGKICAIFAKSSATNENQMLIPESQNPRFEAQCFDLVGLNSAGAAALEAAAPATSVLNKATKYTTASIITAWGIRQEDAQLAQAMVAAFERPAGAAADQGCVELVDEIIDCFGEDSDALKVCSLVCRAWIPHCRSHLFETGTLVSDSNILGFCDFLQSPGCTFLQHVRRIDTTRYYWDPDDPRSHLNRLAAGLCRLTRVVALEMAFHLDPLRTEMQTRFNAGFFAILPHITVLTLYSRNPLTLRVPLIDIISRCHVLQELYIFGAGSVAPPPPRATPPPGLHRLTFGLATSPAILLWLNAAEHLPNVDSITLSVLYPGEAPYISAALQKVGGALRHLELSVHVKSDLDSWNVYDLSLHPHLRTLSIRYLSQGIAELEASFHVRLLALITKLIAGPALESLSIYFRATVSTFDWGALEAFLSSARFPRLREVVIECKPGEVQFRRWSSSRVPVYSVSYLTIVSSGYPSGYWHRYGQRASQNTHRATDWRARMVLKAIIARTSM
ncbi:hypothetical protein DFH08DRAFT_1086367 [Mycena albidolilacea]|uniref:Uncharacterized protein n=1 Tax=Mycena albidolilacea TaxID=1033008 RepID=A0AAD7EF56_9AGAR|nr:hypothetical protein DFH08DRAFT_1086367 [Mycena albidolilacea]